MEFHNNDTRWPPCLLSSLTFERGRSTDVCLTDGQGSLFQDICMMKVKQKKIVHKTWWKGKVEFKQTGGYTKSRKTKTKIYNDEEEGLYTDMKPFGINNQKKKYAQ